MGRSSPGSPAATGGVVLVSPHRDAACYGAAAPPWQASSDPSPLGVRGAAFQRSSSVFLLITRSLLLPEQLQKPGERGKLNPSSACLCQP